MPIDSTFILLIPAMLLSFIAQMLVKSTFAKYSQVPVRSGLSGAEAAATLARRRGLGVGIVATEGFLSDHYNPDENVLALSPEVYSGRSIAALGVAAHELGHAIQKAEGYWPMYARSYLVPAAALGSNASWLLFMGGLVLSAKPLLTAGIVLFSAAVLFSLVTLPVEFDASARALRLLNANGLITPAEASGVKAVLGAAALTYVAAALMAVVNLVRMLLIARERDSG